jgi:hypothetical protein
MGKDAIADREKKTSGVLVLEARTIITLMLNGILWATHRLEQ